MALRWRHVEAALYAMSSRLPDIDGVVDLQEIGRGGFGVVYRGTEVEFGREVAVKVLMSSIDERTRRRFERERRAMGTVSGHQNIVTVFRGGQTEANQPYLVMEYLPGGSLDQRLEDIGPIDWRAAAAIGAKLADALSAAHRAGILHRDVKPGNIFQTEAGEPKLGDFGIARLDDGQDSRTGSITASVAHAPPEIVDGQRGDERSDLYSLASTVYALTIGAAPFSRTGDQRLATLLSRISHEDPPGLHLESAASEFEAALAQALSKNPDDRQDTVAAFGNQLSRAALAPITQPLPKAEPQPSPRQPETLASQPPAGAPTLASNSPPASPTPVAVVAPTAAPARRAGMGQLAFFAALALVIAGFGGWAVARAALGAGDTAEQEIAQPTVDARPTRTPAPTVAVAARPATAIPAQPTAVPEQATVLPAPTVPAAPLSTLPDLDVPAGFTQISDSTRSISIAVPTEWTRTIADLGDFQIEGGSPSGMTAGATFLELSGDPEVRDLTKTGVHITTFRLDGPSIANDLLDVSVNAWPDCARGDRAELLHPQGPVVYQILACDREGGEATGVVIFLLTLEDNPEIVVQVFLQLAEEDQLERIDTITYLRIDAGRIPPS